MNWYGTGAGSQIDIVREIVIDPRRQRNRVNWESNRNTNNTNNHDDNSNDKLFCDNAVYTAKYSFFSFLPIALFEQFRRLANMYFLFIVILMLIGTYTTLFESPLTPWAQIAVLFIVISFSMGKSAVEDLKRHEADYRINHAICYRLNPFGGSNIHELVEHAVFKDVQVGDLVYVRSDEQVPADIVLLTSSEPFGCAYIETSNIDGETNLKVKNSAPTGNGGLPAWSTLEEVIIASFRIDCETPNSSIHSFQGKLVNSASGDHRSVPLNINHLLLRGSSLKNTKWAIGVVVYTGIETKLAMNSRKPPFKVSFVEKTMNRIIMCILGIQVILSLVSMTLHILWYRTNYSQLYYLCLDDDTLESVSTELYTDCIDDSSPYPEAGYFFTFFILYSNMLPISMYVTVELCNMFQAYFIDSDIELYDPKSNSPATARTSTMNADLGMVEYIFSDKTGTLTDNEMCFRGCSIGGVLYGETIATSLPSTHIYESDSVNTKPHKSEEYGQSLQLIAECCTQLNTTISDFVLLMAVCHTVFVDTESGILQAESPDEEALVRGASELGWTFSGRNLDKILVGHEDQVRQYQLLATIPFDSVRMRMSVVVQAPDGKILLLSKGADSVMFARSINFSGSDPTNPDSPDIGAILHEHTTLFATLGLRTLVLAQRELDLQTFREFQSLWAQAETATLDKKDLMRRAAEIVECKLTILGATAIEDKLQDRVPETIQSIGLAGIKLWVLTGDKIETAINIGYASKLLRPEMVLIQLSNKGESLDKIKQKMRGITNKFRSILEERGVIGAIREEVDRNIRNAVFGPSFLLPDDGDWDDFSPLLTKSGATVTLNQITSDHLALILDGEVLGKIFGDVEAEQLLLAIGMICKSVLACRVSPEQKRLIVKLVKTRVEPKPVTLSIGDGANDVAMIQEAQIGVGISGKEGRQAVNASDFAIAQFKFLKKLLFVHGRLDYRRTCKVVLFSFYKNICMTLVLWIFTHYSGYSGQSLFDNYIHSAYNLILALPVVAMGVFDIDISPKFLMKNELMYATSRKRSDLNVWVVLTEFLQALADAAIIFFIPFLAYNEALDIWTSTGYGDGIWIFGTTIYICLVGSMFCRIANLTHTWTVWTHAFFWGSVMMFILFMFTYQYYVSWSWNFYTLSNHLTSEVMFWMLLLLVPSFSGFLDLTIRMIIREYFPTLNDIGKEIDGGESEFRTLLPHVASTSGSGGRQRLSSLSEDGSAADLRYAGTFSQGQGDQPTYPLGYDIVVRLFGNFSTSGQQIETGSTSTRSHGSTESNNTIEVNPAARATYTVDHIVSSGVDGLKFLMSFPLIFGSISSFSPSAEMEASPSASIDQIAIDETSSQPVQEIDRSPDEIVDKGPNPQDIYEHVDEEKSALL